MHLALAADEVVLKAETVVDAVVDPFQGAAPMIPALPGRASIRGNAVELSPLLV